MTETIRIQDVLGCTVDWVEATQEVVVTKGNTRLTFKIGSDRFDRVVGSFETNGIELGGPARLVLDEAAQPPRRITVIPLIAPLRALGYIVLTAPPSLRIFGPSYETMEPTLQLPEIPPPRNTTYVILRYIVAKNNGRMARIPPLYTHPDRESYGIAMVVNGVERSRTLTIGEGIFWQNGHIIAERSFIEAQFGLTRSRATHEAWDRFDSRNDAALAFSLIWTPVATAANIAGLRNFEVGAIIYGVMTGWNPFSPNSHFTFGNVWFGGVIFDGGPLGANVIVGLVHRHLIAERGRPFRSSILGLAHTHPYSGTAFSPADRDLAHGRFDLLSLPGGGVIPFIPSGISAMPVFMSVHETRTGPLIVSRFDNTMPRTGRDYRYGREIFRR